MLASIVASFAVALQAGQTPKPPVTKFDAHRDVTIYSTGDVRTAGYSGYGARFEFPGKTPTVPATIEMGFGALRPAKESDPDHDPSLLHWNDVKAITLSFAGQSREYPAIHAFNVSHNKLATAFLGRALEESLSITLTPADFATIAGADSIQVQLGKDTQTIKGKSLAPLKALAACIPHS